MPNSKVDAVVNTAKLFWKQNNSIILVVGGVIGMAAGTIIACTSVKKFNEVKEECIQDLNDIHDLKPEKGSDRSEIFEYEKNLTRAYIQCGLKLGKIVAPAAATIAASGAMIFWGYGILNGKHAAALSLLATEQNGFKKYRERVIEKEGQEADNEYYYGEYTVEKDIPVLDKKGNQKVDKEGNPVTTKETERHVNCPGIGIVKNFEECTRDNDGNLLYRNPNWRTDNRINYTFCKGAEDYVDACISRDGFIFLNDAYAAFGFPKTKEGQFLVKVYDPSKPIDPLKGRSQQFDARIYGPGTDCGESYIYDHEEWLPIHFDGFVPIDSVDLKSLKLFDS